MNPHRRLCSLIRNTPPASAPHFLRGALFHLQIPPELGRKGAPPLLHPVIVAAMSTSPHEINLCPMLPHHFLLHAKSLPGPTPRAPLKPEAGFRPLQSQVLEYIQAGVVGLACNIKQNGLLNVVGLSIILAYVTQLV